MSAQSLEALAKANEVRLRRADMRRKIQNLPPATGREIVTTIIRWPGDLWRTATVDRVLQLPHRTGPSFSRKMRRSKGLTIGEKTRIGDLTDRQRAVLVAAIYEYGRNR